MDYFVLLDLSLRYIFGSNNLYSQKPIYLGLLYWCINIVCMTELYNVNVGYVFERLDELYSC